MFLHFSGYCTDPAVVKSGKIETTAKIADTINKVCNEARRGISKLAEKQ